MENIQLKEGQKIFDGVLIEFSDIQGKTKKDNKDFHFAKINVDLKLTDREGKTYTRLCEFIADPGILIGVELKKYSTIHLVFEIISPMSAPRLVKILSD